MTRKPCKTQQQTSQSDIRDTARLLAEIASLRTELSASRLEAANLRAAIGAALSAHEDGEADPFWFLRDEIGHSAGDGPDA